MTPKSGHVHIPVSKTRQIPHNQLTLATMSNFNDREPPHSGLGKSQLHSKIARGQHTLFLTIDHRKIRILIDDLGPIRGCRCPDALSPLTQLL